MKTDRKRFWYSWDDSSFFAIYKDEFSLPVLLLTWPGEQDSYDEILVRAAVDRLNSWPDDVKLKKVEMYADNGSLSHYDIINAQTGEPIFGYKL